MRISCIEIKDFRAFSGEPFTIDLTAHGKNLLVYGENGSGKSSLYLALKNFLECATKKHNILDSPFRNIFVNTDGGFIKLTLNDDAADKRTSVEVYEWSHTKNETDKPLILEADKTKGFIDYKALLRTYFLHQEHDTVNIFDLLVMDCLPTSPMTSLPEPLAKAGNESNTQSRRGTPLHYSNARSAFSNASTMRFKLDDLQKEVGKFLITSS